MKTIISWLLLLCLLPLVGGCGLPGSSLPPVASLTVQNQPEQSRWQLPQGLRSEGSGNVFRVVKGAGLDAPDALELAAGGAGHLTYSRETAAAAVTAALRLQFLSTQGTGRIKLAALDQNGAELAAQGWVITGSVPKDSATVRWTDKRSSLNYTGQWITAEYNSVDLLGSLLSQLPPGTVRSYRLTVEAGQGQHVLITSFAVSAALPQGLTIKPLTPAIVAAMGDTISIAADVVNHSGEVISAATIDLLEPYGYGIVAHENKQQQVQNILPGETRRLTWAVTAARPHSININKPWKIGFALNQVPTSAAVEATVTDNRQGKIFYVMTEDLEAIDGAGYSIAWGNQNGWLDPEEMTVQIVSKAEKLNDIANQYGAKWTHYLAWPLVRAANWAVGYSTTGKWPQAVEAITQSVRSQAAAGHEYGIHLHMDYDPYLPGNVLSYNQETAGLWANHLRHGWAHSLAREGSFGDYASRTGTLYTYQAIMDELSSTSAQGQLITARVGSFDFGAGEESEAMSTRVYKKVGLLASSDADGNEGRSTAGPYGGEIYFAKPDDINTAAVDLKQRGLVQFRPTPSVFINYDTQSAAVMNKLADEGVSFFTGSEGAVNPGVHGIIGFTHAMFVMGQGDWKSTAGGQFAVIDSHLRYLTETYTAKGTVVYGTAGDLVRAWLHYHTPEPVVLYGRRLSVSSLGVSQYAVEILGDGIPVDSRHMHQARITIPLYLRDGTYRAEVLKNGIPVASQWGRPSADNHIDFSLDDKNAVYTLKVYHLEALAQLYRYSKAVKAGWRLQ